MIPVCRPILPGKELEYVTDCVKTNWISSVGKYVTLFEDKFAKYCGCNHGVAVCNGTVALHLALATLHIEKGDEVIVPNFTMMATINAIMYTGAKPVLVDSDKKTWNIDPDKIEEKITERTKAILPVHIYGFPADMNKINKIANEHDLYVIEDAAEAHGATYNGDKTGSLGDIGCFSFYGNKILTTGEGGMIVTNKKSIAERARYLRNQTLDNSKRRFKHREVGFNYRMTNLQAAIGLAQTEKADYLVECRRNNAKRYNAILKDVDGITLPPTMPGIKNVYWMYSILVPNAKIVGDKLKEFGVDTRPFFYPMHRQPVFCPATKHKRASCFPDVRGRYPISDFLAKRGLNLPSSPDLTDEEVRIVCDALKEAI